MNGDENVIHKYYAPFLPLNNNEYVSSESYSDPEDTYLLLFNGKKWCIIFMDNIFIAIHRYGIRYINRLNRGGI